jgi:WD40 repeat protein
VWVGGTAGIGKSFTLAKALTRVLEAPPPDTLLLPFRFKVGDDRCSRGSFVQFAIERLESWNGLKAGERSRVSTEAHGLDQLRAALTHVPDGRRVVFVLDGLDEIAARDQRFAAEVPLALAMPRVAWVCAGRDEFGLPEAFRRAGAVTPWPDGLPRMSEADIHEMLLERLGPLRKRLVRGDREEGDHVVNAFVQRVERNAEGLPIYVRYVVNDALGGKLSPESGALLPPSLSAYHERILEQCDIGDLRQVLSPLVGTLVVAREPLTPDALADLLARRSVVTAGADGEALVRRGLSTIGSIVRRMPTPEGDDGFTLYHHSFREHVLGSPRTTQVVATARRTMADAAVSPGRPAEHAAARYLLRHGVSHLVEADRPGEAVKRLTDFAGVMERLQGLQPGGAAGLDGDWHQVRNTGIELEEDAQRWRAFVRERAHILQRGSTYWPAVKILLQLAVEHADDSPVTRQAEAWLLGGHCDWLWLRNPRRPRCAAFDPCIRVFDGHAGEVNGACELTDGRVCSWSDDGTLRLWSGDAIPTTIVEGHTGPVTGVIALRDDRILSWSADRTLRIWTADGAEAATLEGHTRNVLGARELRDGRLLSWAADDTLRLWTPQGGDVRILPGHERRVCGACELGDGRLLSWSEDCTLRLWAANGDPIEVLRGHRFWLEGATELPDGRILSWSRDGQLRLWDSKGAYSVSMDGHHAVVGGVVVLPGQLLLTWSWDDDDNLRLWTLKGSVVRELVGHTSAVRGVTIAPDGRIVSWSWDGTLRVWSSDGRPLTALGGHAGGVEGGLVLADGRLLSWSADRTLRLWSLDGESLATLAGHTSAVKGALQLASGRILSWAGEGALRLWSIDGEIAQAAAATSAVRGTRVVSGQRLISWSEDHVLRLWTADGGLAFNQCSGPSCCRTAGSSRGQKTPLCDCGLRRPSA